MFFSASLIFALLNVVMSVEEEDCGYFVRVNAAVFKGREASRGEFPFSFPLVTKSDNSTPFCSGNLISKHLALTGKSNYDEILIYLMNKSNFSCALHCK